MTDIYRIDFHTHELIKESFDATTPDFENILSTLQTVWNTNILVLDILTGITENLLISREDILLLH